MKCPVPKCIRRRFIPDCKEMQIGWNDEHLKAAAFVFIERHFRFCAPFEKYSIEHKNVEREGQNIGTYRITVEQVGEENELRE